MLHLGASPLVAAALERIKSRSNTELNIQVVTINVSFVPYLRVVMYFIEHLSARRLAITKLLLLFLST